MFLLHDYDLFRIPYFKTNNLKNQSVKIINRIKTKQRFNNHPSYINTKLLYNSLVSQNIKSLSIVKHPIEV